MASYYTGRTPSFATDRGYSPYVGELLRRRAAQGLLFEISGDSIRQISFAANIGMKELVNNAAANMTGQMGEVMSAFADAVKNRSSRRVGMLKVHQNIGNQAQAAIVNAYSSISRPTVSYRLDERYAGGKMRQALKSPGFFEAQPDGLLFINKTVLDSKAAQWYRLNFGAGDRGHTGTMPKIHRLLWPGAAGSSGGSLGLRSFGPSASFNMPLGLFTRGFAKGTSLASALRQLGQLQAAQHQTSKTPEAFRATLSSRKLSLLSGGLDALFVRRGDFDRSATFFPFTTRATTLSRPELRSLKPFLRLREEGKTIHFLQAAIPTAGIQPEGFLEAGMQSLAQQLPLNYMALFKQWLADSANESRGPAFKAGITGARATELQNALSGLRNPTAYRAAYARRIARGLI